MQVTTFEHAPPPTATRLRMLFVQGGGERAGAESALLARLRHLSDHGIDAAVAFLTDGPFRREVEELGVETVVLGEAPRMRDLGKLPGIVRTLADAAQSHGADLLEGCGEKMSALSGWAARRTDIACVYNLQDAPLRSAESAFVQAAMTTGRHDAVVVPSRWMAGAFQRRLRVKSQILPNALVTEMLPDEAVSVRKIADWPDDVPIVGFVGRLIGWKGVDVLLRAFARIDQDARLVVVGGPLYGAEPDIEERLADEARTLGLGDRVHFTGHRDDALGLALCCDVLCHCSVKPEPFGMVVLEGMALGKPVIATRSGGPEDIVDDGRTGILVEPGNEGELARELGALLTDATRRRMLGEAAAHEARTRFASESIAPTLSSIYESAARQHAGSNRPRPR